MYLQCSTHMAGRTIAIGCYIQVGFVSVMQNVTSTTTACPGEWTRQGPWAGQRTGAAGPQRRTPDTRLRPQSTEGGEMGKMGGEGRRNANYTHIKMRKKKSDDENGCVLSLESSQFPLFLQSGLSLLSARARGDVPKWRRRMEDARRFRTLAHLSFPCPPAPFLTSRSGLPRANAPRSPSHPSILLGGW